MIRYEGLRKTYGRVLAVAGLDLEVRAGETLALIGPNGSGKSTTLKAAVGLVRPSAGRVLVDGVDVALGPEARAGLGYLPQRVSFAEGVTARAAMRLYARLRGAAPAEVERLLDRVGLGDSADRVTDGFSGGMRQRLGIAVALLGRPRVLLLDEPTAGMSVKESWEIVTRLREIRDRDRLTVLIVEHDMEIVMELAERITVLHLGETLAEGTPDEVARNADVQRVYLGGR